MSLEATALSPQPSASSEPSSSTTSEPAVQGSPDALTTPKPGSEQIGGNGGPDWRAMLAGEDAAAVERLARFKEPGDVWKSYRELENKVRTKSEPPKFPDKPTPEAIAEWRKSIGVAEVGKDAKPEQYLEAFKIKAPEGYELSAVEKGTLEDFAKAAYEQGYAPREVKGAVDFFFQQQAANTQALNKIGVDFQKEQQNGWRDSVGSKEYEAQVSAASDWLKDQFKESPDMVDQLLQARLPNGGRLGDMRWFGELLAKQAMGDGYTDRIEANTFESNGKTLAQQHREIEALRYSNRAAYAEASKPGGSLDKILQLRMSRGEIDELGNEVRKRA